MNEIDKHLLKQVAELDALPVGAYNIRTNGASSARNTTANIDIVTKTDKSGIDIIIAPNTKNESVHIPVVISQTGLKECVYNDFYIGENCDVTIVAGCGIHNCGGLEARHDGIHTFYVSEGSHVRYIEKHYGEGEGSGKRVMNPKTVVHLAKDSFMELETSQISGIDDTIRQTDADLAERSKLVIHDSLMTSNEQQAHAEFTADLNGEDCSCDIVSRGVARGTSHQNVVINISGNTKCVGHSECDTILMDHGLVLATPTLKAASVDASLVHEAAIGKIAGEQLIKLMSLGLSEEEAEEEIIRGFLR